MTWFHSETTECIWNWGVKVIFSLTVFHSGRRLAAPSHVVKQNPFNMEGRVPQWGSGQSKFAFQNSLNLDFLLIIKTGITVKFNNIIFVWKKWGQMAFRLLLLFVSCCGLWEILVVAAGRASSQCLNTTDKVFYVLSTGVPEGSVLVTIVVLEVIFT